MTVSLRAVPTPQVGRGGLTVGFPSDAATGDLLLFFNECYQSDTPQTPTVDGSSTGVTLIHSQNGTVSKLRVYKYTVTGSETDWHFDISDAGDHQVGAVLGVYDSAGTPVVADDGGAQGSTGGGTITMLPANQLSGEASGHLIVATVMWGYDSSTNPFSNPVGYSGTWTSRVSVGTALGNGGGIQVWTAPSCTTSGVAMTCDASTATGWAAAGFVLNPPATAPTANVSDTAYVSEVRTVEIGDVKTTATDQANLTETIVAQISAVKLNVSDTVVVTESTPEAVPAGPAPTPQASDLINVSEVVSIKVGTVLASPVDLINVSETREIKIGTVKTGGIQQVVVTEIVEAKISAIKLNVSDTVYVSEPAHEASPSGAATANTSDTAYVSEVVEIVVSAAQISASDQANLSETLVEQISAVQISVLENVVATENIQTTYVTLIGTFSNSAASGTNANVNHGVTINENDLIVVQVHANTSDLSITDNNGSYPFTQDFKGNGAETNTYVIATRRAGASEPSNYSWILGSSQRWEITGYVFRGVADGIWDVPPSIDTMQQQTGTPSSPATAPSITVADGSCGLLIINCDYAPQTTTWSNPTNGYGNEVEPSTHYESSVMYCQLQLPAGSTGTTSATPSTAERWTAHQVALLGKESTSIEISNVVDIINASDIANIAVSALQINVQDLCTVEDIPNAISGAVPINVSDTVVVTEDYRVTAATIYYVDATNGSDSNDGKSEGAAWKTLDKVHTSGPYDPGDQILFKRGETWEETILHASKHCQVYVDYSGVSGNPITFGAYGTGDKPKLLASLDLSDTGDWTEHSTNIWVTGNLTYDIGNLIFNTAENAVGVRLRTDTQTHDNLDAQGEYWHSAGGPLYLYSTSNPGSYYSRIKAAQQCEQFYLYNADYITICDLDMRYNGSAMIHVFTNTGGVSDGVIITRNNMEWCGGSPGTVLRAGNAVQTWRSVRNFECSYNTISQVYDAAMSQQGQDGEFGDTVYNQHWHHNTIDRAWYFWEYFQDDAVAIDYSNLVVEYNNATNSDLCWCYNQRFDGSTDCRTVRWTSDESFSTFTDCAFRYNQIRHSTSAGFLSHVHKNNLINTDWEWDYNGYWPNYQGFFSTSFPGDSVGTLAEWQTLTGKEEHSYILADITVNDTANISEAATVSISAVKISVSDGVLVSEDTPNVTPEGETPPQTAEASDTAYVSEQLSGYEDTVYVWDIPTIEVISYILPHADVFDNVNISEIVELKVSAVKISVNETVAVSENIGKFVSAVQISTSDVSVVTEVVNKIVSAVAFEVSDLIVTTETAETKLSTIKISVADGITVTETVDARPSGVFGFDTVTVNEVIELKISTIKISVIDNIACSEIIASQPSTLGINVSDSITVADVPDKTVVGNVLVTVTDLITVADIPTVPPKEVVEIPNAVDNVNVTEVIAVTVSSIKISVTDNITVEDIPDTGGAVPANTLDTVNVSDSATIIVSNLAISVTDAIIVTEVVSVPPKEVVEIPNVADNINVSDVGTVKIGALKVSAEDNATVADASILQISAVKISVADSLTVADIPERAATCTLNAIDNINVSDVPTVLISAIAIDVTDTVIVTENVSAQVSTIRISSEDNAIVADSPVLAISATEIAVVDTCIVTEPEHMWFVFVPGTRLQDIIKVHVVKERTWVEVTDSRLRVHVVMPRLRVYVDEE